MGWNLSCNDVGWAMTGFDLGSDLGSNLGGELLLGNIDVFGSLDHTCIHNYYHKQVHQSVKKKKEKFNHAYSKVDLDLDDS